MDAWNSVQFTSKKDEIINTKGDQLRGANDRFSLCLVGSLWSSSPNNHGAFKTTLMQVWKLHHGVEIKDIGKNLLLFQFFHWKAKEKVLSGEP